MHLYLNKREIILLKVIHMFVCCNKDITEKSKF